MIDQLSAAAGRDVPRETIEKLLAYEALVRDEARRQNLVSEATLAEFWTRHVIDSAQLVRFEPTPTATWVDIGSGAGLPGIVIACMVQGHVSLVEPRRLRAEFLHRVVESLGLNATITQTKAEHARGEYDVITARAVSRLANLLEISAHLSTTKTVWVLPKGRSADAELAEARQAWQGVFHVEQSVTDADSKIVVATGVRAKQ